MKEPRVKREPSLAVKKLNRFMIGFIVSFIIVALVNTFILGPLISPSSTPDTSVTPVATPVPTPTPDATAAAIRNNSHTWVIFLGNQPRSQGAANIANALIGTKYGPYRIVDIISFYEFIHPGNPYDIYVVVRIAEDN